ncbi:MULTISPECIES: hypothetical protein [Paraburkholderia]|uniref:hypothetical protein n=1 Tax=Paraburkholderia TaxID=1822464 RepID=UPI0032183D0B
MLKHPRWESYDRSADAKDLREKASAQDQMSRYNTLLAGPIASIVCNVPERPEVQTIAILGYN